MLISVKIAPSSDPRLIQGQWGELDSRGEQNLSSITNNTPESWATHISTSSSESGHLSHVVVRTQEPEINTGEGVSRLESRTEIVCACSGN
jgi:hypothetical protein